MRSYDRHYKFILFFVKKGVVADLVSALVAAMKVLVVLSTATVFMTATGGFSDSFGVYNDSFRSSL